MLSSQARPPRFSSFVPFRPFSALLLLSFLPSSRPEFLRSVQPLLWTAAPFSFLSFLHPPSREVFIRFVATELDFSNCPRICLLDISFLNIFPSTFLLDLVHHTAGVDHCACFSGLLSHRPKVLSGTSMPRECITIQCGQCGNQIGYKFWELALREHATCNDRGIFDSALSSFFHNVDTRCNPPLELRVNDGCSPIQSLKARAVLIDMEEGAVNQLLKGPLLELFDNKQNILGTAGSGNNWAHGHNYHGPKYADAILDKIRLEAESCDSLQSFFMLHSLGGGTGSGTGSYILELLHDAYPKVFRFCASIFPSRDDDVVTSPYNRKKRSGSRPVEDCKLTSRAKAEQIVQFEEQPFNQMNAIAANLLLNMTSSMRFEGPLNVDLNEITMNLVPFPSLHFLVSSMAPLSALSLPERCGQQSRSVDQVFTEVFSHKNQLMKVDPSGYTYLACALLMRGNLCNISDLNQNVSRIQKRLRMVHWNTEGFKVGHCKQPPLDMPYSLLCLANNTCIGFAEMRENFSMLYKRKVYVHHYTEYMDLSVFDEALGELDDLIGDYATLEIARPPNSVCRMRPILHAF